MIIGLFRNRLRPEATDAYAPTADRMDELVRGMPGFRSLKTFTADDGERISVFSFDSDEHMEAWRTHAEHLVAQRRGRDEFYEEYELVICTPVRESRFRRER